MKAAIVALALCALFAVSLAQDAQSAPADAVRFAETEAEDASVLAEQEQMFEDSLDMDEDQDEDLQEDEADEEMEDSDEAEVEDEDESADETEDEEEAEEETEADESEETEDEQEEEAEEGEEAESDEESEEESEEEQEDTDEFVLAELQDNPKFTGFMQMTAQFIPTESAEAAHLVHSLSSHQQAAAHQQYSVGYAHGAADAAAAAAPAPKAAEEGEDEEEEAEEGEEAAFVEQSGSPRPVYGFPANFPNTISNNYGPTGHAFAATPYYMTSAPPPPPVPTWLPPPPYIPPVPAKGGGGDDE